MLEENVAGVGEDIEVVDQEYQVQDTLEQGKLPPNLQLCWYFQTSYSSKIFWKKKKNLVTYVWQDILPPYLEYTSSKRIIRLVIKIWLS